ncbi:protein-cysteine N-palmitoyltransferase porcupine-like protein [Dinothrombium tinctorium]|uniref:Protein-serine O-palmitoleoyltransferase porcupine n=1 Tax=Dinothrombium tinctorium TaxID=1965070 RepID=A0A3S3P346_9ACAR|nr:protein-cysteine N-palmitoyltransferase porcupine-like protein [Dinothrombium tinctorium]
METEQSAVDASVANDHLYDVYDSYDQNYEYDQAFEYLEVEPIEPHIFTDCVKPIVSFAQLDYDEEKSDKTKTHTFINSLTYMLHPQALPTGGYHPYIKPSPLISWQYLARSFVALLCVTVTKPSMIEFPRSLVDVVVAWNIPIHIWLKKYVFEYSRMNFGYLTSIILTYFISSFMHGLDFKIWSVLLSLGMLTWIEFMLRKRLAQIYNACIEARKCRPGQISNAQTENLNSSSSQTFPNSQCNWGHENSFLTPFVNLGFSLLAVIHLAFLGSSFDGKEGIPGPF